jgi:TMEM175 potassium channel family protein
MESAESGVSGRYERGSEEFSRVLAFSDGLFAIAMTLLVVGITVPGATSSVHDLAHALNERKSEFTSFFISFAVIGRYWAAHHQFVAMLARMDASFVGLNLLYLAFIAFLPFPTALLGSSFENPLSIVIYAVAVAIVSGMEVVLFRHAQRHELLRLTLPEDVYRFGITASLSPVMFFVLSMPVAFVSTTLAVIIWFGTIPFNAVLTRRKPPDSKRYLGI